jgi:hypothetical protein
MESKSGKPQLETDGGNPELSLDAGFVSVSRSASVAVGAEKAQVIESVVSAIAVDVIELQWDRPPQPTCLATHRALGLQDSFLQQSISEFEGLERRCVGEIHVKRLLGRQSLSLIPTLAGKVRRVRAEVLYGLS